MGGEERVRVGAQQPRIHGFPPLVPGAWQELSDGLKRGEFKDRQFGGSVLLLKFVVILGVPSRGLLRY